MIQTKSENFLAGISDYYFNNPNKKSKDKRNHPPIWMKFKLHQKEWEAGWNYAKGIDINAPVV